MTNGNMYPEMAPPRHPDPEGSKEVLEGLLEEAVKLKELAIEAGENDLCGTYNHFAATIRLALRLLDPNWKDKGE